MEKEDTFNFPTGKEKKLTDWANEPTVIKLKTDIDAAKPAHDAHIAKVNSWNDLRDVKGKEAPVKIAGRSSVQPKLIRRQAEWKYPALAEPFLSTPKLVDVKPATFEDKDAALQNEIVINHQFRNQINRVKFIDDYVRATVDEGSSLVQVGWDRHVETVEEDVPIYAYYRITDEQKLQEFSAALELQKTNPRAFTRDVPEEVQQAVQFFNESDDAIPVYAEQTGTKKEPVEKVRCNKPTLTVLDLNNAVIDPSCQGDLDKAMFIAVSFESSRAELEKNPDRYSNLEAIDWDNLPLISDNQNYSTQTPTDFRFQDVPRRKIVVTEYWGYWDTKGDNTLTPIVASWIGNVMIRCEENPFPDRKLPFILVPYLPVKRSMYGESDAELIAENQRINGAVMRGIIDLLGKSANSQQGIAKGLLDPVNQRRYEQGENYLFNGAQGNPSQHIITHTFPELPNSAITLLTMQNQDAESMVGTKAFSDGINSSAYGNVAAGIRGMTNAQGQREISIVRRLANGIVQIAHKIIAMNAVWLSDKEIIRITNSAYQPDTFIEIYKEDLPGNFDVVVDVSTSEVDNAQAQDLTFLLQTIGPDMEPQMRYRLLAEIARLKKLSPALIEELLQYNPPQPDELMMRAKEAEVRKLELENEKLQSEVELNKIRAQAEMINAQAEMIKAQQDASGLTHQRDVEKQQAQGKANQDLQISKALLTPRKVDEQAPDIAAGLGFRELSGRLSQAPNGVPSGSTY